MSFLFFLPLAVVGVLVWTDSFRLRPVPSLLVLTGLLWWSVFFWDPAHGLISHHGLMHHGLVEGIRSQGLPPESPMLAGHAVSYPWLHHAGIAGLCDLTGAASTQVFALTNFLALCVTMGLIGLAGWRVSGESSVAGLSVFLAIFATSAFEAEPRAVPIVVKFLNINSMPLGLLAAGLVVLALTDDRERPALLAGAICLAGLLYPLLGLAIGCIGLSWIALCLIERRWSEAGAVAVAVGMGALLPVWYLWQLRAGVSDYRLWATPVEIGTRLFRGGLTLLPMLALAVHGQAVLRGRERHLLIAACIPCFLLYLLVHPPGATHYKFLMVAAMLLSVPAAHGLLSLAKFRAGLAVLVQALMLLPLAVEVWTHFATPKHPSVEVVEGRLLPVDPAEAELVKALRTVPANAVIVDRQRTSAAIAGRSLLVGVADDLEPGWGMTSRQILVELEGHSADEVAQREQWMERISSGELPDEVIDVVGARPIYAVLRTPQEQSAWSGADWTYAGEDRWIVQISP